MTRARALAAVVSLAIAAGLSACAPRQSSSLFVIRSGHGATDLGGKAPRSSKADQQKAERASREAIAKRAAERPASLPSIERLDTRLRESLAELGRHETPDAHVAVARNYWRVQVYDAAFDHYSDALTLDPKDVAAWDGRARVWRHWGLTQYALSDVHRAIYYGPGRPEALNTLGTILEEAGQCDEARAAYSKALKADPSAASAKTNLDRLVCTNLSNPSNLSNPPNPTSSPHAGK